MKTENQKIKAFEKIIKCISSSKTIDQLETCSKMNDNYKKLFEKEFPDVKFYSEVLNEDIIEVKKKLKV